MKMQKENNVALNTTTTTTTENKILLVLWLASIYQELNIDGVEGENMAKNELEIKTNFIS